MVVARGWHVEDIKAELRKRFGEMTSLATSWGYSRAAISVTLATDHSQVLERRIAEALQVPLHELWPDRWNPDGTSRPRSRWSGKRSLRRTHGKRQKGSAA
jgi:Ner family transcriptional regulator